MSVKRLTAYSSDEQAISQGDFVRNILRLAGIKIRVAVPATVKAYNEAQADRPPSVDVQPGFQTATVDDQGKEELKDMPLLQRVPVVFYAVGGFKIVSRPKVGEEGLVVFLDRSGASWLENGGVVDPKFSHMHSLSDGFFFPGVRSSGSVYDIVEGKFVIGVEDESTKFEIDESTGALVLESADEATILASADITVDGANVTLVGDVIDVKAASKVILMDGADDKAVRATDWMTFFNNHTHPSPMGPTSTPSVPATPSDSWISTKVELG